MKSNFLTLAWIALAAIACAGPLSAQTSHSSTTTPDDAHYKAYLSWNQECEKSVATMKGKPCNIIFIGDSITRQWVEGGKKVWEKYYEPRHALDFGVKADMTQNVLWRLDNMDVKNFHPKVEVLLIGINNAQDTPQHIANGVRAIIDKTQKMYSGVKVILVSIMPSRRENEKMMDTNKIIKRFADNKTIYFLDLVPLMPPVKTIGPDGKTEANWKGLGPDRLHPTEEGYQIWAQAMEPLLSALLAGKTPDNAALHPAVP